jgi:hypothetical protein
MKSLIGNVSAIYPIVTDCNPLKKVGLRMLKNLWFSLKLPKLIAFGFKFSNK